MRDDSAAKRDSMPAEMSIDEASKFWDTHSVADYPSKVVKMEFSPEGKTDFLSTSRRPEKNQYNS